MIQEFIDAWDENNKELLRLFKTESPTSYQDIVEKLVMVVLNPYLEEDENGVCYPLCQGLNISKMTVIDDGDYQGITIYIIPCDTYQPNKNNYYITDNYYGSCSGCDTFEGIRADYNLWDKKEADKVGAAKEFHTLALHLLQSFKCLGE